MLFWKYILVAKLDGKVLKPGVKYKNPLNAKDLTPLAFTFWQIRVSNMLPQRGHLNNISHFNIYLIWMFISQWMVNLPIWILNPMFTCRNQGRSGLPFARMLTSMFVKKWRGLHQHCGELTVWILCLAPIDPRLDFGLIFQKNVEDGETWLDREIDETLVAMDELKDLDFSGGCPYSWRNSISAKWGWCFGKSFYSVTH